MGIFEPYRALGYVTDGTPFSLQRRGMENFVTVSVGKAWQIYNVSGAVWNPSLKQLQCLVIQSLVFFVVSRCVASRFTDGAILFCSRVCVFFVSAVCKPCSRHCR